jgi:ferredoxin
MAEEPKKVAKLVVNRDLCIGAASCVVNAGGVFELDGENKAVMLKKGGAKTSDPTGRADLADESVSDQTLLEAAKSCPTRAILVYDEDGKQLYP